MSRFYTNVTRYQNKIQYIGYKEGKRITQEIQFEPSLFVQSSESTDWTSLYGAPLAKRKFKKMSDARDFIEEMGDISNRRIYGNGNFVTQFIQQLFPHDIQYDVEKINIVSFDIEVDISEGYPNVEEADKPLTSISYKSSKSSTYNLMAVKDYDKTKTLVDIPQDDIQFFKFDSEKHMLVRFMQLWQNNFPDVVTGWNVEYFDVAYIFKRIEVLFGQAAVDAMSPWGRVKRTSRTIFNRVQYTYEIAGISVIDYMDAFKKFGYKYGPQESYKLDHIAYAVLGEKKLDYSEYGSLTDLWEKNPQLYIDYNLKDTYLVQRLEEESGLLSLVFTVAYSGGVNFSDAFGTVAIWESIIYRRLMKSKIVPPIKTSPGAALEELVGGFVKDPKPGMYKWVVSFDLNSLYPMLMLQYNMSPETIVRSNSKMPKELLAVEAEMKLRGLT